MYHFAAPRSVLRTGATVALALAALVGSTSHAESLNPVLSGGLGAMAGAFIGQSLGGRDGAMIGAAVGGAAGVSMAGGNRYYRSPEPVHQVVYEQPYAPVPTYGYRVVERVNYVPVPVYERGWHHGWAKHGREFEEGHWGRHGWDRRD